MICVCVCLCIKRRYIKGNLIIVDDNMQVAELLEVKINVEATWMLCQIQGDKS